MRGATTEPTNRWHLLGFQSTRPLRGATEHITCFDFCLNISIHAPLAGRDVPDIPRPRLYVISIHAPLAGRDIVFPPALICIDDFNPRAPCGARHKIGSLIRNFMHFNPRAPCGARPRRPISTSGMRNFNPRAPCGARLVLVRRCCVKCISIHAPLAGRDCAPPPAPACTHHFNPRAPCGARQGEIARWYSRSEFQSTRPLRGATRLSPSRRRSQSISIHAPLAGRDGQHRHA